MNILFSEIILLLHLLIFLFITLSFILIPIGYFQKWEWVKNKYYRSIHLILMGIISIETILGFMCPLTILENYFRDDIKVDNKLTEIAHQILYWDLPNYQFIILYILSFSYLIFLWIFFKPNLN